MGLTPQQIAALSPEAQAQIKNAMSKRLPKKVSVFIPRQESEKPTSKDGWQIINGKCPSKSNSYTIINVKNRPSLAKTKRLTDYEKSFYLQCDQYRNANIDGLFEIKIKIFNDSNRADLDNAFKIILDCLQKVNAIQNDNNCIKIFAEKFIDKNNPRIEFSLTSIK